MKSYKIVHLPDNEPDNSIWGYCAGKDGIVQLSGNKQVLTIACMAAYDPAYLRINNGDLIMIPRGPKAHEPRQFQLSLSGTLIDPIIQFMGTDSFFIEYRELK